MQRFLLTLAAVVLSAASALAAEVTLRNPAPIERNEWPVVIRRAELESRGLQVGRNQALLVLADGQPIASQMDDLDGDGVYDELAFLATIGPEATRAYQIEVIRASRLPKFTPRANALLRAKRGGQWQDGKYIGGKPVEVDEDVMPQELIPYAGYYGFEGVGWESDKIAYRLHLDQRNTIDAFGKLVDEMILDQVDPVVAIPSDPPDQPYTYMHPWGTDVLLAGGSLGIGTLAAVKGQGSNISLEGIEQADRRITQVLARGPVRAIVRVTYEGWQTSQGKFDVIHEIIMYGGQHWFENRITVGGTEQRVNLASGFVRHLDDLLLAGDRQFSWMSTHGQQEAHNQGDNLGLAVIFPRFEGATPTGVTTGSDGTSFYFQFVARANRPVSYYALAAWDRANPELSERTAFNEMVDTIADNIAEPIQIMPDPAVSERERLERGLAHAKKKFRLIDTRDNGNGWPGVTNQGQYTWTRSSWTEGFYPGAMWMISTIDDDPFWTETAGKYTERIKSMLDRNDTHDLGFLFYPTMALGSELTGNTFWQDGATTAARNLITRFTPQAGIIRAWGPLYGLDRSSWTIIDAMMNLELLYWASEKTGDPIFAELATRHALNTAENQVREDGSSFHVVIYDLVDGHFIGGKQHQGFLDNTTWSRGQAWGMHGFANTARWTGDPRFRQTAEKMARFIRERLPIDGVPYWDYQAPHIPNGVRDTSAASIYASGLLDLADTQPAELAAQSRAEARQIILELCDHYLTPDVDYEEGVLARGSVTQGGDNRSMSYGDYYFVEALVRLLQE